MAPIRRGIVTLLSSNERFSNTSSARSAAVTKLTHSLRLIGVGIGEQELSVSSRVATTPDKGMDDDFMVNHRIVAHRIETRCD